MQFDSIDRNLLSLIQDAADLSRAELGRRVGLTGPAVQERLRKLEEQGVIVGRHGRLDPRALGFGMLGFVLVKTDPKATERAGETLGEIPGVQEIHHVAGEDCFLVKVRAADPEAMGRLIRHRFHAIPSVRSTRTTIVLQTLKESLGLPVAGGESDEPDVHTP